MNRRKFFGFLAVAPVAVPAAVMAAKPAYASGGFPAYHLPGHVIRTGSWVVQSDGSMSAPHFIMRMARADGKPVQLASSDFALAY